MIEPVVKAFEGDVVFLGEVFFGGASFVEFAGDVFLFRREHVVLRG